jgi:hypothetical protein
MHGPAKVQPDMLKMPLNTRIMDFGAFSFCYKRDDFGVP